MRKHKSLQESTILDRFLFNEVMENPENLQMVLEIILGKEVVLKHLPQTEKEQRTSPLFRSIRMDVWAQDMEDVIYDTEVQQRDTGNLPKRSRYYQALTDSKLLEPGSVDFNKLNPVYIILIAPFDLFGQGRYMYTFDMQCQEVKDLRLNDGGTRIFLNTHGKDMENISPELKELLYYMEHTNEKKEYESDRIRELQERVRDIQNNEEVGVRYMQAWEERVMELQEAREEGKVEGKEEEQRRILERLIENGIDEEAARKLVGIKSEN